MSDSAGLLELGDGDQVTVRVGAVAHGGHCVARVDGQVVFVRHALPGELVTVEITETHRGYLRGDAVAVLEPAPRRVTPPCPYAGPGACGGCDLQHVAPEAQLDWKADVIREQLRRLGGLTAAEVDALAVRVRPLPGGPLGWRTRVRYAVDAADRAGLLKHRSHEVVPVDRCLIAHPAIQRQPVLSTRWPGTDAVETVVSGNGEVVVTPIPDGGEVGAGSGTVTEVAVGRRWRLPAGAFWQVHPAAADTLAGAVLELLDPRPGESAWDLYGGAGLFAAAVAGRTGPSSRVTLVENAATGIAAARANLADLPQIEVVAARVETALARRRITGPVDLVVLDPPRAGAGARVVRDIAGAARRAVAYVACDPAALARDVRTFRECGWTLRSLVGFDCFPMTQHIECVASFTPGEPTDP
ncbi:TRAM domain-containing protein [Solwaraspora sp. WMMD406]|uniref:class I SAM-dependent RNA methyltransferase n=1 Tax=Solwaraspora sp. WMMD406 TaxID=3016095 RepID=UPI002417088E|nr:TRAM domain-containing protein [Solwaraspora sp. WMMD406]MDG4766996.1 TRAM domain-containing protein [Solwaraspora sp. WMMD406]